MALNPGAPATGSTLGGGAAGTACETGSWGPQVHYTLRVPPGRRAVLTATPTGTTPWRAVVRARSGCTATACLAAATSPTPGTPAVARYENRGTTPVDLAVAVASTSGREGGTFTLGAALEDVGAAPPNATCTSATMLANGASVSNEVLTGASVRLGAACVPAGQGPSLFYRVSVPAGSTLLATATPQGGLDPVLRVLDTCTSTTCRASVNATGANQAETLAYTNSTSSAQSIVLAVGSAAASPAGSYNLSVNIAPAPTNTRCAAATALPGAAQLTLQNATQGTENVTGACLPMATGTALFYTVDVPAGQTLTARATPYPGMDAVVRLLSACGATTCLASANTGAVGAAETLRYANTTSATQRLVLAVGGATNATNGVFDLDVALSREYLITSIPPACETLAGGAAVPGVAGDDSVSPAADLPFPFTFFGARQLEYTVNSNGLVQLFPALPATGSNAYINVAIPNAATPNGFIAAFWDDLFPVPMVSRTTQQTLGTAPARRFVVEWRDYSFFSDRMARLTFQAKLFETTGVIELHYCAINPGTNAGNATGASATVGIESPDGRSGTQHSFERAMAVSAAAALRFTP